MAKSTKRYRPYPGPQQGAPMWRDPAHVKGSGCGLVVLVGVGLAVTIPAGVASLFI